jgi:hypothetical protein
LNTLNAAELEAQIFPKLSLPTFDGDVVTMFINKLAELIEISQINEEQLRLFIEGCVDKADESPSEYVAFPCIVKEKRTQVHQLIKSALQVCCPN